MVDSVDTGKSKFDKEGSSGEYPILGSTSVIGYDDEYDYEGDFILTARVGANAGSLYRHAGKVKISDNTVYIQASQNIEFLYQLLIRFDIKRLSFGTGQPLVKASELKRLELMMPTDMEEQMRIGVYFKNLDHLITLHQRKYFIIYNKLITWEQRKLGDIGKATGGTSIESEFSEDGIYKVISIGSYSENSVYNDQGIRAIKSDKTSNRVLNRNDLTMILNDKTTSGNIIGRVLLIEESGIYVYNQRTERIEINLDEYDSVFLYEMLNAPNIREKIIKQAQGNTQIYVNWTAISLLKYMIPSKEEQVKIGEYLHSISNLITLHRRAL